MKRKERPLDGVIVGLLLILVLMQAWQILVGQQNSSGGATGSSTGQSSSAPASQSQPGSTGPTPSSPQAGTTGMNENSSTGLSPIPGVPASPEEIASPSAVPGTAGKLHLREYLAAVVALQSSDSLQITREQARQMLPVLLRYQQVAGSIPTAVTTIFQTLDDNQKAFLDKKVPHGGPPTPDPRHSFEELLGNAINQVLATIQNR